MNSDKSVQDGGVRSAGGSSQPTYTVTLRDVYGVDTVEEVWARFLPYREPRRPEHEKYEMTGEFRPARDEEYWIGHSYYLGIGKCGLPRLILRPRRVKRWRLAPGEQPRKLKVGDVMAWWDTNHPDKTTCVIGDEHDPGYEGEYGFVLEQYEEEA